MGSESEDTVSFTVIENEKENITSLKKGRSAKILHDIIKSKITQQDYNSQKQVFETALLHHDNDTLDTYMEYINWLLEINFKGPQNDILLQVIERCLVEFNHNIRYRNDPRYLEIWLLYIDSFYMDALTEKRDMFIYLFRNKIGETLSIFYVEFSKLLFAMNRYDECYDFLMIGIQNNAMPNDLLLNSFKDFKVELEANGIVITPERNMEERNIDDMLLKYGNIKILDKNLEEILKQGPVHTMINQIRSSKLDIHVDDNDDSIQSDNKLQIFQDDWTNWETKSSKLKENKAIVTPLIPNTSIEPIKQDIKEIVKPSDKILIFNDDIGRMKPIYKTILIDGQKPQRIDYNFDLINNGADEYNLEQLLAIMKGCYRKRDTKRELDAEERPLKKPHHSGL
ncbi:hypothetical protein C6P45_003781 [Maudiozyma exigua]|uniref:BUB1 N-terminal domain-containing protein n=1 Tax=Maudiozyma exigua TaxID=34358 RepID=A0A9P6WE83_MAUEX|nr:hypothetical protein C6P45_003781 [Kazachstania exigua]